MAPMASVRDDAMWIILVCTVILAGGLLLYVGVWLYGRWWLRTRTRSGQADQPWTLDELQQMRQRGDLTESEYQAMRATLVAAYRDQSPPPRPMPAAPLGTLKPADDRETWDWTSEDFDLKKPPEG